MRACSHRRPTACMSVKQKSVVRHHAPTASGLGSWRRTGSPPCRGERAYHGSRTRPCCRDRHHERLPARVRELGLQAAERGLRRPWSSQETISGRRIGRRLGRRLRGRRRGCCAVRGAAWPAAPVRSVRCARWAPPLPQSRRRRGAGRRQVPASPAVPRHRAPPTSLHRRMVTVRTFWARSQRRPGGRNWRRSTTRGWFGFRAPERDRLFLLGDHLFPAGIGEAVLAGLARFWIAWRSRGRSCRRRTVGGDHRRGCDDPGLLT